METLIKTLSLGTVVILFISVNALFLVWFERKVSARIQLRRGPMTSGPFGLLQTMADAVKLISKELIRPKDSHYGLYVLAPMLVFAPIIVSFIVIPIGPNLIISDLHIGVLLIFAFSSLGFIGIFIGGWASNSKYAVLGAIRSVAQNIAYEIPLLLSTMGIILITGTFSLHSIVLSQEKIWFVLIQPLALILFFCSMLAETNRAPFDIPEAESEIVAGFHTEYSGMQFALFFLAEYTNIFIGAALVTTLFLGGWYGPFLPPVVWFVLKTYIVVFVIMWIRWTFPRLRSDQLIYLSWKVFIPLSIINLIATATVVSFI